MSSTNKHRNGSTKPTKRTPTKRAATSSSSAKRNSIPLTSSPYKASSRAGSKTRSNGSHANKASQRRTTASRAASKPSKNISVAERVVSSRPAIIAIIVLAAILVLGIFDTASNSGKAFGNVSINGIDVGGKTSEEIKNELIDKYAMSVSHAQITIYANEAAEQAASQGIVDQEQIATAEQISNEEAIANIGSWQTDALSLKATVPYEKTAEEALAYGRDNGGFLARLGLLVGVHDIDMHVNFNDEALDDLASEIDRTIGDPRKDTTVEINDGNAVAVQGHSGTLVDRAWLADMISRALMYDSVPDSFVAVATNAQSRISMEQAQKTADGINQAITPGATFTYQGKTWNVDASTLGDWTNVDIVEKDGKYDLDVHIDSSTAAPAVVKGTGAVMTSDDVAVAFEKNGNNITVHASGSGSIPEVTSAVADLNNALYGDGGAAWGSGSSSPVEVAINESDRPESLTFDEALDLGIITCIGEYTTEFSNSEGTENRNHNIKLAADLLNNSVVTAKGGRWDFNERTGPTDESGGFWEAGSIVEGEYVDSVGGGICQVATTVFNAVYESGLPVIERHNHSLYIASYPTGRDAAVDYPSTSLVWENDLPSDVLLKMSYTDTSVTAQLYSVYTGYTVDTQEGNWQKGAEYGTRFEVDDSIGASNYYRKTTGADGQSISVTRIVKDDTGKSIRETTFDSNYKAKDEIYVVGSKVDTSSLSRR